MRVLLPLVLAFAAACEAASDPGPDAGTDPCAVPGQPGCCAVDADCGEGTTCTQSSCVDGRCVPKLVAGCCAADGDCDDQSSCTTDHCDVATGICYNAPFYNGLLCDDGDVCTFGTRCNLGFCVGGNTPVCDDHNPCTVDSCVHPTGCHAVPTSDGAGCDDGRACTTGDACRAGSCLGVGVTCDDGDPCTVALCDATTGACVQVPGADGAPCVDADVCTFGSTCFAGACVGGKIVVCNDGNPCTSDACVAGVGCKATALGDETPCDDGSACTLGDGCHGGSCHGGAAKSCDDGLVCTTNGCDPVTGSCTSKPAKDGTPCVDDEVCTFSSTCQAGVCNGGTLVPCDDGNPCTTDVCISGVGCKGEPVALPTPCNDGSPCTEGDACSGGACVGTKVSCDDGDPCTIDSCQKATGCAHEPSPYPACK